MRLASLRIENYRTLESIDLSLPSSYAAICGANDSGKTNIVRAIRVLVTGDAPASFFLKNRYRKLFVTFDLDSASEVENKLKGLQLEKGKHYAPIGLNEPGKANIEGLLPASVTTAVFGKNPDLVQAATSGASNEQKSAKAKLKSRLLDEFKQQATPGRGFYEHFYTLSKTINKALI